MAAGIKNKVAIIGMGCTKFGELWDKSEQDLMVDAYKEALADAGVETKDIDAAWFGSCFEEVNVGKGGIALARALNLPNIAVTRVENFCTSGTEAIRGCVLCRGIRGLRYSACAWRRETQRYRLWRSAGFQHGNGNGEHVLPAEPYRPGDVWNGRNRVFLQIWFKP